MSVCECVSVRGRERKGGGGGEESHSGGKKIYAVPYI